MKKSLLLISLILFFHIFILPAKNLAGSEYSSTMDIKYTIWADDYYQHDLKDRIIYLVISCLVVGAPSFTIMKLIQKKAGDTTQTNSKLSYINSVEDISIEKIYTYIKNENVSSFKEKLFLKFVDFKNSFMEFDYNKLQQLCTKDYYRMVANELNTLLQKGYINYCHTFVIKKSKISDIHDEGNLVITTFFVTINYYNYVENREKEVIYGRKIEAVEDCYKIEYVITKDKDNITCLKCGRHVYLEKDGECPYCQSPVIIEAKDYLIRNITKY